LFVIVEQVNLFGVYQQ